MIGEGIRVGGWVIPEAEIEERFDPYGGPGGQHANKTETAVTVRFRVEGSALPEEIKAKLAMRLGPVVEVSVSDTRSQWRNRELARERLGDKIGRALVEEKPRKRTKPTKGAVEARLLDKKARSEVKKRRRRPEPE